MGARRGRAHGPACTHPHHLAPHRRRNRATAAGPALAGGGRARGTPDAGRRAGRALCRLLGVQPEAILAPVASVGIALAAAGSSGVGRLGDRSDDWEATPLTPRAVCMPPRPRPRPRPAAQPPSAAGRQAGASAQNTRLPQLATLQSTQAPVAPSAPHCRSPVSLKVAQVSHQPGSPARHVVQCGCVLRAGEQEGGQAGGRAGRRAGRGRRWQVDGQGRRQRPCSMQRCRLTHAPTLPSPPHAQPTASPRPAARAHQAAHSPSVTLV